LLNLENIEKREKHVENPGTINKTSWSVFDQAKTLSFSAVIKWLSAVL
jgi:hypothetical protein